MSTLFRAVCRFCGWTGLTRVSEPSPKHRCPECRSASLKTEPAHTRRED